MKPGTEKFRAFAFVRLVWTRCTRFLTNVADGFCAVHTLDAAHIRRVCVLMDKYADLPMDLADASLVLLAEHIGEGRILSTDQRGFQAYRFKNQKPFQNVLMD